MLRFVPACFMMLAATVSHHAVAANLKSVSRIAFGPSNILFVADWKAGCIHAFELPSAEPPDSKLFNLTRAEDAIRQALGASEFNLEDLAVRPQSNEAYIALTSLPSRDPVILVATAAGKIRKLDLDDLPATSAELPDQPDQSLVLWDHIPGRSFIVTDMQWYEGKLYVAGLSNQAFSSTLRILPYPFTGPSDMLSVEMYHTSHNQWETRAPIRAMTFAQLAGKPYLIAAYLCTPLVIIPVEELQPNAHVKAKTVAELGDAGIPVNLLTYQAQDLTTQKMVNYVLSVNLYLGSETIALNDIEHATQGPGLSTPVAYGTRGPLAINTAPLAPAFRVVNFNSDFFLALRRDPSSGHTQLVNYNKALGFRLSDMDVSEYLLPGYVYTGAQRQYTLPVQNKMKIDEGYPDQVRK